MTLFGKRKYRVVSIDDDDTVMAIARAIEARPKPFNPNERALFLGKEGKRLSREALFESFKPFFEEAKLDRPWTLYSCRHTVLTHAAIHHASNAAIAEVAGHSDWNTLMRYTRKAADLQVVRKLKI